MSDIDGLEGLSEQQRSFIGARLSGATVTEAAEATKIHRSTYYDWRSNCELFNRCLETCRARQWRDLMDGIINQNELALETLRDVTSGKKIQGDPAVRLRAAETILSNIWKACSKAETDQRLKKLEEALGIDDPADDCQTIGSDRESLSPEKKSANSDSE